ncbi:hypothetical protein CMV30_11195 [Nibricoccus aquaticus]|uniref:Uncharacterized protein n=1 Tax=Nibricoccus aquaticus TaxID=2576891 RepID=A0A290Q7S0_9BACT|nr:hypothetical protein CMV30_11195 [Nibricoccus aquaticus]
MYHIRQPPSGSAITHASITRSDASFNVERYSQSTRFLLVRCTMSLGCFQSVKIPGTNVRYM